MPDASGLGANDVDVEELFLACVACLGTSSNMRIKGIHTAQQQQHLALFMCGHHQAASLDRAGKGVNKLAKLRQQVYLCL